MKKAKTLSKLKQGATTLALCGVVFAAGSFSPANAQTVTINGQALRSNVAPITRNGRTLVAMRPIFEGLGAAVQWNSAEQSITAKSSSTTVLMRIGNPLAVVNGNIVMLEQAPLLYNGNTMVPLRFVSESLGAQVNYNASARSIGIATTDNRAAQSTPAASSGAVSLQADKQVYVPNEPMKVSFAAPAILSSGTWIGIIPSDTAHGSEVTNRSQRLTYSYTGRKANGTVEFKAPTKIGTYDLRINDKDSQLGSITFEVKPVTPEVTPTMRTEKTVYVPGEPIALNFTAFPFYSGAWVGILPTEIPSGSEETNRANRLTYQYLGRKTQSTLDFKAPTKLGEYDFRMNDGHGNEIALLNFTVEPTTPEVTPTIAIAKTHFDEGETIELNFTSFPFYSSGAWVGIVPAEIEHGDETLNKANRVSYQYIGRKTQGTLTFKAPNKSGRYDFRFHDGYGNELAATPTFGVGDAVAAAPADAGGETAAHAVQHGGQGAPQADGFENEIKETVKDSVKDRIRNRIRRR